MSYAVKEIVRTIQGEGAFAGRPAVFCRFTGCNLWSGREADRSTAVCQFCDTDFLGTNGPGGGIFAGPEALADTILSAWQETPGVPYVVFTGGEPLLQLDLPLVQAVKQRGIEVALETNGTRLPVPGIDWICVSPKAGAPLRLDRGDELKLIYPQPGAEPEQYAHLEFDHFFLQPMMNHDTERNTRLAEDYCRRHPTWRLSVQTHKLLGLP